MKSILFISPVDSSFVRKDLKILQNVFCVKYNHFYPGKFFRTIQSIFTQCAFLISNINSASFIFIWFADYHSLLPSLFGYIFRKPVFIVLGGYDTAKIAQFNYGAHLNRIRHIVIWISCRLAKKVLPVSKYTAEAALQNIGKWLHLKIHIIYNGVNTEYFRFKNIKDRKLILTVSYVSNERTATLKGLEEFCELAKYYSQLPFVIVGITPKMMPFFKAKNIANLKLTLPVSQKKIRDYYWNTTIICQFSEIESFGLALAEGMSCGCVPLARANGALPEIVDQNYLVYRNMTREQLFKKFEYLLKETNRKEISDHISSFYSLKKRSNALLSLFRDFV